MGSRSRSLRHQGRLPQGRLPGTQEGVDQHPDVQEHLGQHQGGWGLQEIPVDGESRRRCRLLPCPIDCEVGRQEVTGAGVYIVNCRYVKDGFFGALEVYSAQAVTTFLENADSCETSLGWKDKPDKLWGEDKFAQRCMEKHGVDAIEDLYLFKDAVCDMIEAKSKKAKETGMKYTAIKMEPKVQTCEGDKAIAFHPLKKPYDYFTCVKNAQA